MHILFDLFEDRCIIDPVKSRQTGRLTCFYFDAPKELQ